MDDRQPTTNNPRPVTARCHRAARGLRAYTKGQTLIIVALMGIVLVLFVGLGVDVGNLMGKRAKLQSAVDASALSAVELLVQSGTNAAATNKAYQMLETNGVPTSTLNMAQTFISFPAPQQIRIHAVQHATTLFMRIVPIWSVVDIEAEATADINSYAEINAKPYGQFGVVNELNLSVWGVNSWRKGGDGYSPQYISGSTLNPQYSMQPYGYLYRIDVPPSYSYSHLVVQIFDPDSYNRPDNPPPPPTPCGLPCTPTPTPTWTPDNYAYCAAAVAGKCTDNSGSARYNTGLRLYNADGNFAGFSDKRPAFWRVDEERRPHGDCDLDPGTDCGGGPPGYQTSYLTRATFTLWHFNPHITSAFDDPTRLSDYNVVSGFGTYLAQYDNNTHQDSTTDLKWYQPPGFDIQLTGCGGGDCFAREDNGGFYFYLYVRGTGGSSENNFDLRAGPPSSDISTNTACDNANLGAPYTGDCYVNKLYYDHSFNGRADWNTRGVSIFAKRAMALNLDTGNHFPMLFVQVPKEAAGQTLGVRHFDQDCTGYSGNGTCSRNADHTLTYQMQKCGATDLTVDSSFVTIATGYVGPDNGWTPDSSYADPEQVPIPAEGSPLYNQLFGDGISCSANSSWMRLQSDPSYSQDTTVWEMPFVRPRLIK